MEKPKPIQELFHLDQNYIGVPRVENPYIEVSMIDKHQIEECFQNVSEYGVSPITIEPKAGFKDLQEALTKPDINESRPPSVSHSNRFKVSLQDAEIPLSYFFNPPLHTLDKSSRLMDSLHEDVNVLCTTTMAHHRMKKKMSTASDHYELVNEQELFAFLLRVQTKSPWVVHQQCETTEDPPGADVHLPKARFDLMINHGPQPGTPASANVVIKVNGNTEEKPDIVVTNKTDTTMRLRALNPSAVLESFIFSEINDEDATRVILATESYIRPLFRIKSFDCMYTTKLALRWCECENDDVTFDLEGCVLFLLLVKSGMLDYPAFQPTIVIDDKHKCGWNAAYSGLPVKYSKTLKQIAPQVTKPSRGKSLDNSKLKVDRKSITEYGRQLKRQTHSSDET